MASQFQARRRCRRHRAHHLGHARALDERHRSRGDRGTVGDRREGRGRRRDQGRGRHLRQGHVLRRRRPDHAGDADAHVRASWPRRKGEEAAATRAVRREPQAVAALPAHRDLRQAVGRRASTAPRWAAASSCASPAITASPPTTDKTRLGLPEIKVGLFPGAGGTQRIARMMPPADALQFLLKGDQLRLNRAKAMKLVDAVVPAGRSRQDRQGLGQGQRQGQGAVGRRRLPAARRAGLFEGRHDDVSRPRTRIYRTRDLRQLSGRARDHAGGLRGPAAADGSRAARRVALLRQDPALAGSRGDDPLAVRLDAGAQQGRAAAGRTCRRRRSRRSASSARASWAPASPTVSAQAGIDVVLIDRDQESADKGKAHSQKLLTDQVNRGRATRGRRATRCWRASRRPPTTTRSTAVDLVIEAVFEDRKVKAEATAKAQAVIGDEVDLRLQHLDPADHVARRERQGPGEASSASTSSRRSSA